MLFWMEGKILALIDPSCKDNSITMVGSISWGLPVLWEWSFRNKVSYSLVKAWWDNSVRLKHDGPTPKWFNPAHGGDSGGLRNKAQWCIFVRFLIELLTWKNCTKMVRYFTLHHIWPALVDCGFTLFAFETMW